jgi:hypothetical protein
VIALWVAAVIAGGIRLALRSFGYERDDDDEAEVGAHLLHGSPYATGLVLSTLVLGVVLIVVLIAVEPLRVRTTTASLPMTAGLRPTEAILTRVYLVSDAASAQALAVRLEEADRELSRLGLASLPYQLLIVQGELRQSEHFQQVVELNLYRRAIGLAEYPIFDMRFGQAPR